MLKKIHTIISINPGSRYMGIAVFRGFDLREWDVKSVSGSCSKERMRKAKNIISWFTEHYNPDVLAIKRLHPSRSSTYLNRLVSRIKQSAKRKGLNICQYSIQDMETFFSGEKQINKQKLAKMLTARYPVLAHEFTKEKRNLNPYYVRMFEAVALGVRCAHQIDKQ